MVGAIEFGLGKVSTMVGGCCQTVSGRGVGVSFLTVSSPDRRCRTFFRRGGLGYFIRCGGGVISCFGKVVGLYHRRGCSVIRVRKGDTGVTVRLLTMAFNKIGIGVARSRGATAVRPYVRGVL